MSQKDERRTFVAVPVPSSLKKQLSAWIEEKRNELSFRKWIHQQDIHITLHFLGSTSSLQLEQILKTLHDLCKEEVPFALSVDRFGTFGKNNQPHVFWAGVAGELDRLHQLQKRVTTALQPIGFPAESRPYHPHITLARKYAADDFQQRSLSALDAVSGNWIVDEVVLYGSILGKEPMYHVVETFPFGK
jgi:2'-5' RNA ligase